MPGMRRYRGRPEMPWIHSAAHEQLHRLVSHSDALPERQLRMDAPDAIRAAREAVWAVSMTSVSHEPDPRKLVHLI